MKVRIGYGLGRETLRGTRDTLTALADGLEARGFDSLWFSERLGSPAPDPIAAMAFVIGRTERLKVGVSVLVLPGRNLAVLAKELATLDQLAEGKSRVLPNFGLGAPERAEHAAFGVRREDRAAMFEEALPLLRRLWAEDGVTHHGEHYHLDDVTIRPKPRRGGFDLWIGAMAPKGLERVGRLGDGWLASFCIAKDVAQAMPFITGAAEAAGRTIDPEHIGAPIIYREAGPLFPPLANQIRARHPGLDPEKAVPPGLDGVRRQIEEFLAVGASKFVILPTDPIDDVDALHRQLDRIHDELLPLQT